MRLDRYLADMNLGTRKELKKAVRDREVTVDGTAAKDPGMNIRGDETVTFRGKTVNYHAYEYYMMNKPAGVLSATGDKKQKTVLDLLDEKRRRDIFPVGRLDRDTVGLILLSNDGQLAHRILSPKSHVDKVYFVRVRGILTQEDKSAFVSGIRMDEDLIALPAVLKIKSTDTASGISEAFVTIREGKFHQIKKMFAALGDEVVYLKRLSIGPLVLDASLPEGAYRKLSEEEIGALRQAAGMGDGDKEGKEEDKGASV